MCNAYNSGGYGCCGFGTNVAANTNTSCGRVICGYWNGGYQRMCRDACGNILTRNMCGCQRPTCCCPCCRPCGCGCGGGNGNGGGTAGNNGNGTTNGNGGFSCVTFCGYGNNLTQPTGVATTNNNAAAYYAQQYGLTCDDNAECVYNF